MNRSVAGGGHRQVDEYMPAAFRHFVRRLALLDALEGLHFRTALDVGASEGFFGNEVRKRFGAEVWSVGTTCAITPRVSASAPQGQTPSGAN